MDVSQIYVKDYFPFLLLLARIGGVFATAPGFGENTIPAQVRVLCALTVTFVLAPTLEAQLRTLPTTPYALFYVLSIEVFIGLFTGLAMKVFFATLHFAGAIMGFQVGMMNAFIADPNFGQQNSIIGVFLGITATFLIFATNIHHHVLGAIVQSYHQAPPHDLPSLSNFMGDTSQVMTDALVTSIRLAMQLSGPFILLGLLMYAGLGVMNRLMPQVPVFFVVQPLIIFLGFVILCLVIPLFFPLFMDRYDQFIQKLWAP